MEANEKRGPARKTILIGIAGVAVLAGLAGLGIYDHHRKQAKVAVTCKPRPSGVGCTLEHLSGGADAHACWDVRIECSNHTQLEGHACGEVPAGGTSEIAVPGRSLPGIEHCDKSVALSVVNLAVTAK